MNDPSAESETNARTFDPSTVTRVTISVPIEGCHIAFDLDRAGHGTCQIYDNGYPDEQITVTIDPTAITEAIETVARVGLIEKDTLTDGLLTIEDALEYDLFDLERIFWDDVNAGFDDPFVSDNDLGGEPLAFAGTCTKDQFKRLIFLAQLTYLLAQGLTDDFTTEIIAATPDDAAGFGDDDQTPEPLRGLIGPIIDRVGPEGYELNYNDGATNRVSGYSTSAELLSYDSTEARAVYSARERVQAPFLLIQEASDVGIDLKAEVEALMGFPLGEHGDTTASGDLPGVPAA